MTNAEAGVEPPLNNRPHVLYRMFDTEDQLLYVGITADAPDRFHGHRQDKDWWREIAAIRLEHLANRTAALQAERDAIRTERPKYNITHGQPRPRLLLPPEMEAVLRGLEQRAEERRRALDGEEDDIAAALRLGIRKSEIVKAIDRSREHVDRIARRHGIPGRQPRTDAGE